MEILHWFCVGFSISSVYFIAKFLIRQDKEDKEILNRMREAAGFTIKRQYSAPCNNPNCLACNNLRRSK